MKSSKIAVFVILSMQLMLMAGCAGKPVRQAQAPCQDESCPVQAYTIGPGDVLHISVWKNAALDRVVTVRPDGKVSFPLLNDIPAAGLTPMQLQETISDQLKQYMAAPEVSVVVQEIRSFAVSVLGEVRKPGRYELSSDETVLDVLAQAGGLTEFAHESRIVVLRSNAAGMEHIPFNYDAAISRNGGQGLFYLRSGDIVVVP